MTKSPRDLAFHILSAYFSCSFSLVYSISVTVLLLFLKDSGHASDLGSLPHLLVIYFYLLAILQRFSQILPSQQLPYLKISNICQNTLKMLLILLPYCFSSFLPIAPSLSSAVITHF